MKFKCKFIDVTFYYHNASYYYRDTTPLEYVEQVKQLTPENFEQVVSKGRQVVMFCVPCAYVFSAFRNDMKNYRE